MRNIPSFRKKGWISVEKADDCSNKVKFSALYIPDKATNDALIAIGDRIKEKHRARLNELRGEYARAVLADTPRQVLKAQRYSMQSIFLNDGWFCLYCVKSLTESGKLKPLTQSQKRSVMMMIIKNN